MDYELLTAPLLLSVKTVTLSSFFLLLFGIPLAYLLSKKSLRCRWLLDAIVTLPLIFPPIAIGFFLLLLLGREGYIGSFFALYDIAFIFTFKALVIAGFIAGLPLMVKPLQSAIEAFPREIKEASLMAGKSEIATLLFVILPVVKGSLFASVLIASARSMGEVGVTLMLGGNIVGKTDTISLAIYNAVFDGEYELAMILSAILVAISLLFFIALHFLKKEKKIV